MRRYSTFFELIKSQNQDSIAFKYFQKNVILSLTYGELLKRVLDYSIPSENVIGIFAKTDVETIISIFALAGKKQIVLLNPDDNISILQEQVNKANVSLLLGDKERCEELSSYLNEDKSITSTDILFFTSGTTSSSKAVVLTEESLCNATYNGGYLLPLTSDDNLLSLLPLSHVYGFVCALLWPLSFGATVSLNRGLTYIFFDFNEFKPTATTLVPQMAAFLATKNLFNPELKLILIGAGDCSNEILNLITSLGIRVSFGYGLTETSSGIALSLNAGDKGMTVCPDYTVDIAKDSEIIVTSSTTLMKGYYKDKESTKKVLNGTTFKTGDLGKFENGLLYIIGRKKDILVLDDGTKIFIPEFEGKLAKLLGLNADFTILQDKDGKVVLYIFTGENVDSKVDQFNEDLPRGMRITRVIYSRTKLPRTKTNKVKKYLIKV